MKNCVFSPFQINHATSKLKTYSDKKGHSNFINGIVSYFSKGNVSLQNARFVTKEKKDQKRGALIKHKFI